MTEGLSLLLVDDDPDALAEMAELLRRTAPRVRTAASMPEAKRILAADQSVGVVVTDIAMPGGSGLELLDVARLRPDGAAVKVIVLTGYGSVEHTLTALRSRAFDFLVKPTPAGVIAAAVAAALAEVHRLRGDSRADAALDAIMRSRALRRQILRGQPLPDAAWDILLRLASARSRGEAMDIGDLCKLVDATRTSVWRRLGELVELGLVTRALDGRDARRVLLQITDEPYHAIVGMALDRAV